MPWTTGEPGEGTAIITLLLCIAFPPAIAFIIVGFIIVCIWRAAAQSLANRRARKAKS